MEITRLEFLRYIGAGCVVAAFGGLAGCASIPVYRGQIRGGRASVSVAEFDRLLDGKDEGAMLLRLENIGEAVIIMRGPDRAYRAISATCTHQGCEVQYQKHRLHCPCHGSLYTLGGEVTRGPARRPLPVFAVTLKEGMIEIDLTRDIRKLASR